MVRATPDACPQTRSRGSCWRPPTDETSDSRRKTYLKDQRSRNTVTEGRCRCRCSALHHKSTLSRPPRTARADPIAHCALNIRRVQTRSLFTPPTPYVHHRVHKVVRDLPGIYGEPTRSDDRTHLPSPSDRTVGQDRLLLLTGRERKRIPGRKFKLGSGVAWGTHYRTPLPVRHGTPITLVTRDGRIQGVMIDNKT